MFKTETETDIRLMVLSSTSIGFYFNGKSDKSKYYFKKVSELHNGLKRTAFTNKINSNVSYGRRLNTALVNRKIFCTTGARRWNVRTDRMTTHTQFY